MKAFYDELARFALRSSQVGFTLCDHESGMAHATPTALRLLGHVQSADSENAGLLGAVPLAELPQLASLTEAVALSNSSLLEKETRIADGTPLGRWVLSISEVLSHDELQKPTVIASAHLDITESKKNEGGYTRYKTLVNEAPLGIFITSIERPQEILYMNDEMARLLGAHSNSSEGARFLLRGSDYVGFLPEESRARELEYLKHAHSHQRRKEPSTLISLTGRHIDISITTILDHWEEEEAFVFFVEDITNLNREKRALERLNDELREFTYSVSHDLQSPLITIRSFLAKMAPEAEKLNSSIFRHRMQRVQVSAKRLQHLVKDLLELSRVGRVEEASEVISLAKEVDRVRDMLQGRIEATEGSVNIHGKTLPRVVGVRSRIAQLYQNLIENALKFHRPNIRPRVDVAAERRDGKWIFYVEDNGVGVAASHRERVFGAFSQLDVDTEGTGIGLALVKRIVDTHGGSVWLEEPKQGGTRVCFTLSDERIQFGRIENGTESYNSVG